MNSKLNCCYVSVCGIIKHRKSRGIHSTKALIEAIDNLYNYTFEEYIVSLHKRVTSSSPFKLTLI